MSKSVGRRAQQRIENGRHPLIREARELERDAGARRRLGLYLAWGIHLAQEALRTRAGIRRAWIGPALEAGGEGRGLLSPLADRCPSIVRTSTRLLESIVEGSGDQGVILVVERPRLAAGDLLARFSGPPVGTLLLAAHGVQDPGNLGSIARTAEALGAGGLIVLEGCADPFSSRAVRAAMGAQFRMPIAGGRSEALLPALEEAGLRIVASDAAAGAPPAAVDLVRPAALFVGSEGAGLPRSILGRAAATVRIPMRSGSGSINVHAAAAILLYEAARQRERTGS
jgi:TrmH family RNA methyltransferase